MTKWFPENLDPSVPRYQALADAIGRDIAGGRLRNGQRMPTHRDLAEDLEINVSTVTRAYKEAERRGLLSGVVGRGTFVSTDAGAARGTGFAGGRGNRVVGTGPGPAPGDG